MRKKVIATKVKDTPFINKVKVIQGKNSLDMERFQQKKWEYFFYCYRPFYKKHECYKYVYKIQLVSVIFAASAERNICFPRNYYVHSNLYFNNGFRFKM